MARSLGRLWCLLNNQTYPPATGSDCSLNNCADSPYTSVNLGTDFNLPNNFLYFEKTYIESPPNSEADINVIRDDTLTYATYAFKLYQLTNDYNLFSGTTDDNSILEFSYYLWGGAHGIWAYNVVTPDTGGSAHAQLTPSQALIDFIAPETLTFESECRVSVV